VQQVTDAFGSVATRLLDLSTSLRDQGKDEQADIMEVNSYIALDPDLRGQAIQRTRTGLPVPVAVHQAVDSYAGVIAALPDPTLAERAADVRQVGRRVLAHLHGDTGTAPDQPLVLGAHEISAADLLEPGQTVIAAVSVTGGPNSHAAIVARSLGIPLLLAADPQLLDLPDGQEVLLDAHRATAVTHPDEHERTAALAAMDAARALRATLAEERYLPAETLDHHRVTLLANVATLTETRAALEANAEGVGLLRTELPFLNARTWPTRSRPAASTPPHSARSCERSRNTPSSPAPWTSPTTSCPPSSPTATKANGSGVAFPTCWPNPTPSPISSAACSPRAARPICAS
jgi:multiphosphoryl transfer protein